MEEKKILEFDGVAEIEEIDIDYDNWKEELKRMLKELNRLGFIDDIELEFYIENIENIDKEEV